MESSGRCRFDGPPKRHSTISHQRLYETLEPPTMAGSRSLSIRLSASSPPVPMASSPPSFTNTFFRQSRLRQVTVGFDVRLTHAWRQMARLLSLSNSGPISCLAWAGCQPIRLKWSDLAGAGLFWVLGAGQSTPGGLAPKTMCLKIFRYPISLNQMLATFPSHSRVNAPCGFPPLTCLKKLIKQLN